MNRFLILCLTITGMSWLACAASCVELKVTLDAPELGSSRSTVTDSQKSAQSAPKPPAPSAAAKSDPPKSAEVKVGRVANVTAGLAQIHDSRSSTSRVYCRAKAGTPLAVVREMGEWSGVLMANGAVGWVKTSFLAFTDYDLVAPETALNRGSSYSRGGMPFRGESVDSDIIREAMRYRGVTYVYGGVDPNGGMDCSAFVRSVFRTFGVNLPRTAREQAQVGVSVKPDDLKPGDRLYFSCKNPYIDHCGIYAGNGYFIHCSSGRNGVGFDSLAEDFYWKTLAAIKR